MSAQDDADRTGAPLPRDPQDQQATREEDPLAVPEPDWPDTGMPETDVAGTGRRGVAGDGGQAGQEGDDDPAVDEPVD
ncbi:hypothetical protein ACIPPS_12230 [Streptomyces sp. NPDC090127]|uniref:hypothetical protein n=1 Tax=Streptomyces sp. NPDC090127 TaxID=3365953 RepID=UPI00381375D3